MEVLDLEIPYCDASNFMSLQVPFGVKWISNFNDRVKMLPDYCISLHKYIATETNENDDTKYPHYSLNIFKARHSLSNNFKKEKPSMRKLH